MAHQKDVVPTAVMIARRAKPAREAAPLLALPAPPGHRSGQTFRPPYFFSREPAPLRAGIRHIPSGTMTVSHKPLRQVLAALNERARYGGHDISGLEVVVVDWRHRVCAGFWGCASVWAESMV